jgi:predicted amidophosphoribosyltransferase
LAPPLPPPPGIERCLALLAYEGAARELVTALKYRSGRDALRWSVAAMARLVVPPAGSVVTWAPTTGTRRRERGFDQAELLARAIARSWQLPCRSALRRLAGPAQTGRSAAERRHGPSFRATRPVAGPVVIIDDVVTTGATLTAAASTLRRAGATDVIAVALARTPLKSSSRSSDCRGDAADPRPGATLDAGPVL